MRIKVLILVLLVALTGGCVSFASQLPEDNGLVSETDVYDAMETEEDATEEDTMEIETETEPMSEDAQAALQRARSRIGIYDPQISFSLRSERNLSWGDRYFQFEVLYNGVRIQATFLVIHTDDYGNLTYASMTDIGNISLNTTPTISQAEAKAIFRAEYGGDPDNIEAELVIHPPRPASENRPEPEHANYRLAWLVENILYGALIDANSGEIVFSGSNRISGP